jgi:hypothetical protein
MYLNFVHTVTYCYLYKLWFDKKLFFGLELYLKSFKETLEFYTVVNMLFYITRVVCFFSLLEVLNIFDTKALNKFLPIDCVNNHKLVTYRNSRCFPQKILIFAGEYSYVLTYSSSLFI